MTGSAPAVTVVTATYNWPAALRQAMDSALAQTFDDFEYLVIGDCCTDETEDLVRSYPDARIRWHNLPENTGNQSGVNRVALEMARSPLVAYLNHDDLWFPDHLAGLVDLMRRRDVDIVNSVCLEIAPGDHHFRGLMGLPFRTRSRVLLDPMTSTVMHRIDAAAAAGDWIDWRETREVPTTDFFRRVREVRGRFAVLPELTVLKFHSGSRRSSYREKTAVEQEHWAERMRTDPQLRYRETMQAVVCERLRQESPLALHPAKPKHTRPGWQIEQWRRIRGLVPMVDLGDSDPAHHRGPSDSEPTADPMWVTDGGAFHLEHEPSDPEPASTPRGRRWFRMA